ncbi:hypothetical protein Leryth_004015 [Lithospermum erythrorhizon]|nr:hypothetical protein Leryth_004015 [Lithospermum erythrorhizon]
MAMSANVVTGGASYSRNLVVKTTSTNSSPKPLTPVSFQKSNFQGLSLQDAKKSMWDCFSASSSQEVVMRRGLEINARTAAKNIEVEVDKPLGLTLGQKQGGGVIITARATHICLDCGFIYTLQKPFEEQPDDYVCPQCIAPKKRFARYDVNTGKAIGGGLPPVGVIIGLIAGIGGVGALLVYGLQ